MTERAPPPRRASAPTGAPSERRRRASPTVAASCKVAGVVVGAGGPGGLQQPRTSAPTSTRRRLGAGGAAASGHRRPTIPVGGGKIFADSQVVVTQPTAGTFKAFDAVCPHQGCTGQRPSRAAQIICPCHGSHFDVATGARRPGRPRRGLDGQDDHRDRAAPVAVS